MRNFLRSFLGAALLLLTGQAASAQTYQVTGCDGVTDVTAGLQDLFTRAGATGGTVVFPARAGCVINGQGQALAPLAQWYGVSNVKIIGNGATILDEYPYTTADYGPVINGNYLTNISVDGLNLTQVHPVAVGSHVPYGAVLFACGHGCAKVELRDLTVTGAETPILFFGSTQLTMVNVTADHSLYGIVAGDNGDGIVSTGLFVRNLTCNFCDRSVFLRGVQHADLAVNSISPQLNDVLVTCVIANEYVSDIKLQYYSPAADAQLVSYVTIGNSGAWNTATGCVYSNIDVVVNISEYGVSGNVPVLKLIKSTTAALGDYFMNIRLSGTVFPVNQPGDVVDLFERQDAPWGGEHAYNVVVGPLMIAGGVGATFHADLAPFYPGRPGLKLDMVTGLSTTFVGENASGAGQVVNLGSTFAVGP